MKTFFEDMEVEVTEDLKLVEDDEWDNIYEDMCWSKIKLRKSKASLCVLKSAGAIDVSMNKPLPIRWCENEVKHNFTFKPEASDKNQKKERQASWEETFQSWRIIF